MLSLPRPKKKKTSNKNSPPSPSRSLGPLQAARRPWRRSRGVEGGRPRRRRRRGGNSSSDGGGRRRGGAGRAGRHRRPRRVVGPLQGLPPRRRRRRRPVPFFFFVFVVVAVPFSATADAGGPRAPLRLGLRLLRLAPLLLPAHARGEALLRGAPRLWAGPQPQGDGVVPRGVLRQQQRGRRPAEGAVRGAQGDRGG